MSVQTNTYIMVGVMLPYDSFTEEQHEQDFDDYCDSAYKGIHHHNGLCVLADGMQGEYVAIGRVLKKTNDQNGDYCLSEPVDCSLSDDLRDEVSLLLTENFGLDKPDVKIWAFTHWR